MMLVRGRGPRPADGPPSFGPTLLLGIVLQFPTKPVRGRGAEWAVSKRAGIVRFMRRCDINLQSWLTKLRA